MRIPFGWLFYVPLMAWAAATTMGPKAACKLVAGPFAQRSGKRDRAYRCSVAIHDGGGGRDLADQDFLGCNRIAGAAGAFNVSARLLDAHGGLGREGPALGAGEQVLYLGFRQTCQDGTPG